MGPPSPWVSVIVGVVALIISTISATFTAFNYFRPNAFPGTVVVSQATRDRIETYYNQADDFYRQVMNLPNDTSQATLDHLEAEIEQWSKKTGRDLMDNVSITEYRRIVDGDGVALLPPDSRFQDASVAKERANTLSMLSAVRRNLLRLLDRTKVR